MTETVTLLHLVVRRTKPCSARLSTVHLMSAQQILHFADSKRGGCGATVRLETGEPCWLSIAQSGVMVKKSRFGLFGAVLYSEKKSIQNLTLRNCSFVSVS